MSVSAISNLTSLTTSSGAASSSATAASSSLSWDFTTYLKILTTQLKNQDPTNATDPNQYTQELVQMEQVQQQISNNKALGELTKSTNANGLANGVGFMGNYVRAATKNGDFSLQNGTSEFGYTLEGASSKTQIIIKNASGGTVATINGGTTSGDNYVSWNGKDANGSQLADGAYTFTVVASGQAGEAVESTNPTALFKVTSLQSNGDGTLTLNSGSLSLLSTDITGVFTGSTMPTATVGTASQEKTTTG